MTITPWLQEIIQYGQMLFAVYGVPIIKMSLYWYDDIML